MWEVVKNEQIQRVHIRYDEVKSTKTTIPFFKNNNMDYAGMFDSLGEHKQAAGWILFILVTIFIVTAVSNGANLTDGLDGLATGSSAIIGVVLFILAYVLQPHKLCFLSEHHVYSRLRRTGGLYGSIYWGNHWLFMV